FKGEVTQREEAHLGVLIDLLFALERDSDVMDLYEQLLGLGATGRHMNYLSIALGTRLIIAGRYATFLSNEQKRKDAVEEREMFIQALQEAVVRERLNLAEAYAATGSDDLALDQIGKVICSDPAVKKRLDERLERVDRKLEYDATCGGGGGEAPRMPSSAA